jgi:hypothetical protein
MSKRVGWLWALLMVPAGLKAEEAAAPTDKTEEVFVFADKFARWDRTRWYAEMQIGYPVPSRMIASANFEVRATALQLRSQFVCEKTWRRGKRGYEVLCDIEDVSIRATTFEREPNSPDKIFQEMDDKASAAQLRLYVTDDGRVTNIDLEGIPAGLEREQIVRENLRQLYMRLMAGFNLRMPKATQQPPRTRLIRRHSVGWPSVMCYSLMILHMSGLRSAAATARARSPSPTAHNRPPADGGRANVAA